MSIAFNYKRFFLLISLISFLAAGVCFFHQLKSGTSFFDNLLVSYSTSTTALILTTSIALFIRTRYAQVFLIVNFFTCISLIIALNLWPHGGIYPYLEAFTIFLLAYAVYCLAIAYSKTIKTWQKEKNVVFGRSNPAFLIPILINIGLISSIFYSEQIGYIPEPEQIQEAALAPEKVPLPLEPKEEVDVDYDILQGVWAFDSLILLSDTARMEDEFLKSVRQYRLEIGFKKLFSDTCETEIKTRRKSRFSKGSDSLLIPKFAIERLGIDSIESITEIKIMDSSISSRLPFTKLLLIDNKILFEYNQRLIVLYMNTSNGFISRPNVALPFKSFEDLKNTEPYRLNFTPDSLGIFKSGKDLLYYVLPTKDSIQKYLFTHDAEGFRSIYLVTFKNGSFIEKHLISKHRKLSDEQESKVIECKIDEHYTIDLTHSHTAPNGKNEIVKKEKYRLTAEGKFLKKG